LKSDCLWLQFWVELPTQTDVQKYRAFLNNYAAEQQNLGPIPLAAAYAIA